MFLCVALLFSSLLVLTNAGTVEEAKKLLQEELTQYQKCATEGNVSLTVLEDLLKKHELPPTRPVKCLSLCHLKGMKIMSDDGLVNWDRLDEINKIEFIKLEDQKKALDASSSCRKSVPQKTGGDLCDAAYAVTKCFLDETKKLNLRLVGPEDL